MDQDQTSNIFEQSVVELLRYSSISMDSFFQRHLFTIGVRPLPQKNVVMLVLICTDLRRLYIDFKRGTQRIRSCKAVKISSRASFKHDSTYWLFAVCSFYRVNENANVITAMKNIILWRAKLFFSNLGICISKTTSRTEIRIILQEQTYFRSSLRADLISRAR